MTHHIAAIRTGRPHIAGLVRSTGRKLSDRMHAAADDRARASGWIVSETPGRLGLNGRSYHDPRFAAAQDLQADPGDEEPVPSVRTAHSSRPAHDQARQQN